VDYAESYYGIRPLRTNDALIAWTNALQLARDETEREGVYIHLARIKIYIGQFDAARAQLEAVTNADLADMKNRLLRNANEQEHPTTNSVAVSTALQMTETNLVLTLTNATAVLTNLPSPTPGQQP